MIILIMETWENDLNEFMRELKLFPFEKWNKTLMEWCKEYTLSLIHISEPRDRQKSRMPSSA